MIEVEVKIPVSNLESIENKIKNEQFFFAAEYKECDTYYTSAFHDFRKRDEALRVRDITDITTSDSYAVITYKGKKLDQISMSRTELETKVADGDVLKNILRHIGFEAVIPVEKNRREYKKEPMTICLDTVKGLGTFVEIEIIVEKEEQHPVALRQIEALMKDLGLQSKDTTRKSYLSMLEEKLR